MGQFDWFAKIGATPQAVATLNDQPILFTILLIVLAVIILQCVLIWYIHFATMKPEQKVKKDKKKPAGKK
jgi:RsiW-degrading membrane proteinase PrsW (M82 family)